MFVRRRPLMRAAVVGGGAYMVGKSAARTPGAAAGAEADQDARISDLEQQQQAARRSRPQPPRRPRRPSRPDRPLSTS